MTQKQTHDKCKHFSYQKCPYINNDIMKRATQKLPEYYGGGFTQMAPVPTNEEINKICNNCNIFTLK